MHGAGSAITDRHRLGAVRRLLLLGTPPSAAFDRLTRMAATLLGRPMSMLTIVDADRAWFQSSHGLPPALSGARQAPLSYSLCQYVVTSAAQLVIIDATEDPGFRDHPAVCELGVRAYAGSPLRSPDGHVVGALCAADLVPHGWDDGELALLGDLAEIATRELSLHLHECQDARRLAFGVAPVGWS
jgi:GAF domain-containing protein